MNNVQDILDTVSTVDLVNHYSAGNYDYPDNMMKAAQYWLATK